MKPLLDQIRLWLAETLLNWATAMVPRDHPHGAALIRAVRDYTEAVRRIGPR